MALNPFFLHGTPAEQRLLQELVNEQLRMYGVEIIYIPRRFLKTDNILKEVTSSIFNDIFPIEAYINTYEGYNGAGDIMSKFGVSLKDELLLTISKERFEDFIAPFLQTVDQNYDIELPYRPREGDLIYFPLGERLFEVKFVEHEQPFYQLGKSYVYELKCELFEYEDEIIDTSIEEVDTLVEKIGPISTLNLVGFGRTASLIPVVKSGYVNKIYLNNDGSGYTSVPQVVFSKSPINQPLATAQAVAITTSRNGVYSIKEILLTSAGYGYTTPPLINIISRDGVGAAATCSIETIKEGVISLTIDSGGEGYTQSPIITISNPVGGGVTATATSVVSSNNQLTAIRITNPGSGYTSTAIPFVTVSSPQVMTGVGTYLFNEVVVGSATSASALVKSWNANTGNLDVTIIDKSFARGETLVGTISSARYSINSIVEDNIYDKYSQNEEIEQEADSIIDFSEVNPFGVY